MRKCFCLSCVGRALNYSLQQRHVPLSSLMLTCDLHNPGMWRLAAKMGTNPFTEKKKKKHRMELSSLIQMFLNINYVHSFSNHTCILRNKYTFPVSLATTT